MKVHPVEDPPPRWPAGPGVEEKLPAWQEVAHCFTKNREAVSHIVHGSIVHLSGPSKNGDDLELGVQMRDLQVFLGVTLDEL